MSSYGTTNLAGESISQLRTRQEEEKVPLIPVDTLPRF